MKFKNLSNCDSFVKRSWIACEFVAYERNDVKSGETRLVS
jgi:hypothetical protein